MLRTTDAADEDPGVTEVGARSHGRLNRLLHTLLDANQAVLRARTREDLFRGVCTQLTADGVATLAWVGLVDEHLNVTPTAYAGSGTSYIEEGLQIRADDSELGRGTTGRAIRTGTAQVTQDITADERMTPWRERLIAHGLLSSGSFPLRVGERVVGALSVYMTQPQGFQQEEVELFGQLADGISFSLASYAQAEAQRESERQLLQAQKMDAIGRLAGGIAHDFNNLLGVIIGYADLLAHRVPPASEEREDVAQVMRAAERAAELTRRLLAFSRQQVIQPRSVDLNALVHEMDRMLRRVIGANIDLTFAPQGTRRRLLADPSQLEQVLLNLVLNARDAMPDGGRVTVRTREIDATSIPADAQGFHSSGAHLELLVQDSGIGMDVATLGRIFEPFFTTKGPERGTGLGLPTVFGIVTQHGGRIHVESAPGAGTTIHIYLPCDTESPSAESAPPPQQMLPRGTETVLLAEDESALRMLVERTLAACGYTVLSAAGGDAALALAAHHDGPIHLLLTDVVMPRMGGRAVAEALRATRPGVRVLYTSGYAADALDGAFGSDGGIAFLAKPFTRLDLATAVRELLDGRKGVSDLP